MYMEILHLHLESEQADELFKHADHIVILNVPVGLQPQKYPNLDPRQHALKEGLITAISHQPTTSMTVSKYMQGTWLSGRRFEII